MRVGPGPTVPGESSVGRRELLVGGLPRCVPFVADTSDGPRVAAERLAAVEREHAVIRHSAPPPATEPKEEQ